MVNTFAFRKSKSMVSLSTVVLFNQTISFLFLYLIIMLFQSTTLNGVSAVLFILIFIKLGSLIISDLSKLACKESFSMTFEEKDRIYSCQRLDNTLIYWLWLNIFKISIQQRLFPQKKFMNVISGIVLFL